MLLYTQPFPHFFPHMMPAGGSKEQWKKKHLNFVCYALSSEPILLSSVLLGQTGPCVFKAQLAQEDLP